jgi:hypothetical protein
LSLNWKTSAIRSNMKGMGGSLGTKVGNMGKRKGQVVAVLD